MTRSPEGTAVLRKLFRNALNSDDPTFIRRVGFVLAYCEAPNASAQVYARAKKLDAQSPYPSGHFPGSQT